MRGRSDFTPLEPLAVIAVAAVPQAGGGARRGGSISIPRRDWLTAAGHYAKPKSVRKPG